VIDGIHDAIVIVVRIRAAVGVLVAVFVFSIVRALVHVVAEAGYARASGKS